MTWWEEKSGSYRVSNSNPSDVQPVASRYTECTIPVPFMVSKVDIIFPYFIKKQKRFETWFCFHHQVKAGTLLRWVPYVKLISIHRSKISPKGPY
jgi:hypothetical protein